MLGLVAGIMIYLNSFGFALKWEIVKCVEFGNKNF
jgi:hypothetical protein